MVMFLLLRRRDACVNAHVRSAVDFLTPSGKNTSMIIIQEAPFSLMTGHAFLKNQISLRVGETLQG